MNLTWSPLFPEKGIFSSFFPRAGRVSITVLTMWCGGPQDSSPRRTGTLARQPNPGLQLLRGAAGAPRSPPSCGPLTARQLLSPRVEGVPGSWAMLGRRIRYGKLKEGKHGVREPLAEDHVLLGVLEQAPCGGSLGARPSVWYLEGGGGNLWREGCLWPG